MATTYRILNNLNQVVNTLVQIGAEWDNRSIAPREQFDILESEVSPVLISQIQNGILKLVETFDPGPPAPGLHGVNDDQYAALNAAASPGSLNPFATMADVSPGIGQATKLLIVDVNRTDSYTPDGTWERPFKTLTTAVAAATARTTILAVGGVYTESVTLPNQVNLFGMGIGITSITGNVVTGSANCHLRDFGLTGNITINGTSTVTNVYVVGNATITADCQSFNFTIKPTSGTALTSSGGLVTFEACTLESTGDVPTILHTAGKLVLNDAQILGSRAAAEIIDSNGGMIVTQLCFVINTGGGVAIDCQNGATTEPNAIVDTIIAGNVVAGTAATIADAVYGSGSVTGAALLSPVAGSN